MYFMIYICISLYNSGKACRACLVPRYSCLQPTTLRLMGRLKGGTEIENRLLGVIGFFLVITIG